MKIGLALGAGGARGLAHIGALRAMEEAGLEPAAVAGSSMGAVIGAMIAAGHDSGLVTRAFSDPSRLTLPFLSRGGGLVVQSRIIDAFCEDLPERIEALGLPFAAVAVDVSLGDPVVLDRGPLKPALAASIAVPGILEPVRIGGRYLIDGGVLNPVPVDVVRTMADHPVVAVDVTPAPDRKLDFQRSEPWWRRAWERIILRRRPLAVDVFLKAFSIQQARIRNEHLKQHPPDLLVTVNMDPSVRLEDFHCHEEVIEAGYKSTRNAIGQWRETAKQSDPG